MQVRRQSPKDDMDAAPPNEKNHRLYRGFVQRVNVFIANWIEFVMCQTFILCRQIEKNPRQFRKISYFSSKNMISLKKVMFLFHVSLALLLVIVGAVDPDIINKNVDVDIDIATQLVKISHKILIEHTGKKTFSSYSFIVPEKDHVNLAFISVKDFATKKELKTVEKQTLKGFEYEITFPTSSVFNLHVETVFTRSLYPHPSKITQNEKQLVRYFGNAYFYTPYQTATQKTIVNIPTTMESTIYTNLPQPVAQSGSRISYGPYENIARKYIT